MKDKELEVLLSEGMEYLVEFNMDSSIIKAVGYNPEEQVMAILFTSQTIYVYPFSTMEDYTTIRDSKSHGAAFKAMKLPFYKRIL